MKSALCRLAHPLKVLIACLLSVMLIVSANQTVFSLSSGDYTFQVTDGLATITEYAGTETNVVVPTLLDGYPVVAIGQYAFADNRTMTSVTLPAGLTEIGRGAFSSCRYLANVTLPASLLTIGDYSFSYCSALADIPLPEGLLTIGNYAFSPCSVLTSITIPGSVTSIGTGTFQRCRSLTAINVNETSAIFKSLDGVLYDGAATTLLQYPNGRTDTSYSIPAGVTAIGVYAFAYSRNLTSMTIPDGVTTIAQRAFDNCDYLASVALPASISSMGDSVFSSCYSLTGVTLSDGMTSLGNQTFQDCSKLAGITIPASITSLGNSVFYGCSALAQVTLPEGLTSIGSMTFSSCRSLTGITLPTTLTSIGSSAFSSCMKLTGIVLPEGLTSIANGVFRYCMALTYVGIPDSVTSIGDNAFYYCRSLKSITLSSGVTSIGYNAFGTCTLLAAINVDAANPNYRSIDGVLFDRTGATLLMYPSGKPDLTYVVPDSTTAIGPSGFESSIVTRVIIPNSVTVIGTSAFRFCRSLADISIPDSVTTIGNYAFQTCTALTNIDLPDSITSISYGTFMSCISLSSVTIPTSVTTIGSSAFESCKSLRSITIPSSVTTIDGYAFGLSGLVNVTLPDSITSISWNTFRVCESLKSVTIPASVTSIQSGAFAYCPVLNSITFLGIMPPTVEAEWIDHSWYVRGHAYYGSSFPAPNALFNGLKMGTYIPEDYYYSVTDGLATITGYHGSGGAVIVPATLGGCPVVAIGDNAFAGCGTVTGLTLPGSVANIGSGAFSGCSALTDLTFLGLTPPTTDLDWLTGTNPALTGHAYYGSSFPAPGESFSGLTMGDRIPEDYDYTVSDGQATITGYHGAGVDVTIPATLGGCPVVAIGDNAFAGGEEMTHLTIPGHVTRIGSSPFADCWSLWNITFLGLTPPETATDWLTELNALDLLGHAYYGASFPTPGGSLNGLKMSDYIPEDYYYTLAGGKATITRYTGRSQDIETPATLGGCPVVSIGVGGRNSVFGPSVNSVVIRDGVKYINDKAFFGCASLTSVTIPGSVVRIGDNAFASCFSLTGVTIPGSVGRIGESTFTSCGALAQVTLEDGVQHIGENAFASCTSLSVLILPDGLASIGSNAFTRCTSLTSITLPKSVSSLSPFAFPFCTSLTEIGTDPNNETYASLDGVLFKTTYDDDDNLVHTLVQYPTGRTDATYAIPADVTAIGDGAFATCVSLTGISIPESVTSIGSGAFYECTALRDIVLPSGLTDFGDYVFEECTSLTSLTLPAGVTRIGDYTFADCVSLAELNILGDVSGIGDWAFAWCESLTEISLPESVSSLGTCAFRGCIGLTHIVLPGSIMFIGDRAFSWCESLTDLTFLSLTPPLLMDSSEWIYQTSPELLGHAWFGAGFPAPDGSFNGLAMGDYVAQPITDVSPASPLVLYTRSTSINQAFAASYVNHGLVSYASLAVDADTPMSLDLSSFSETLALALGEHTVTLTIMDAAGNEATQTWLVTVIQDLAAPALSGIVQYQKLAVGSPIAISISDNQSGVDWDSLQVILDKKAIAAQITMTEDGFTIPASLLKKGDHSIAISVSDLVGNIAVVKYEFKVK